MEISEQIFQDAVAEVRAQKAYNNLKAASVDRLSSAQNPEDLMSIFEAEIQQSTFFGTKSSARICRYIERIARHLDRVKGIVDALIAIHPKIVAPMWSIICFAMTILREVPALKETFNAFEDTLKKSLGEFKQHYTSSHKPSKALRAGLQTFYANVVKFSLTTTPFLTASIRKSILYVVGGSTKKSLDDLNKQVTLAAQRVYNTAATESYTMGKNNEIAITQLSIQASPHAKPSSNCVSGPQLFGLPDRLSPHFSARTKYLESIEAYFQNHDDASPVGVSVWGIPGIGKSQIALRYAHAKTSIRGKAPDYEHVVFLQANDEQAIFTQYRNFAIMQGLILETLPLTTENHHLVIDKVKKWFRDHDKWLLIFDNVQISSDVLRFRPLQGRGHLLLTTRNRICAEDLTPHAAFEVGPMSPKNGVDLVFKLISASAPFRPELVTAAEDVVAFTRGLPLAIEQLARTARIFDMSLSDVLAKARVKFDFLSQKQPSPFQDDNMSTGAVLISTLETLESKSPKAASLFKYFSYFNPSSIPISMITEGISRLQQHFARQDTYDRGAIRSPQDLETLRVLRGDLRKPFDLFDYDPFELESYKRFYRFVNTKRKLARLNLPRIDSSADLELQRYWEMENVLKAVFENSDQLNFALHQLLASGLVRRTSADGISIQELWIHDLFAELTTAYVATESKKANQLMAHLASITVFYKFPVPLSVSPVRFEKCLSCLSHAESTLMHLKEAGILNDATIGAELSHLTASTLYYDFQMNQSFKSAEQIDGDLAKVIFWYNQAFLGYYHAWNRLRAHSQVSESKIVVATCLDWWVEKRVRYVQSRHHRGFERFGSNAAWRSLNTALKLSSIYAERKDYENAILFSENARRGLKILFGPRHEETRFGLEINASIYIRMGEWQKAHDRVKEQALSFMGIDESRKLDECWSRTGFSGLCDSSIGGSIASLLGRCCEELGRFKDALYWHEICRMALESVYGNRSEFVSGAIKNVARANELLGRMEAALFWWMNLVDIQLDDNDHGKGLAGRTKYDEDGYEVYDRDIEEAIQGFEAVRSKVTVEINPRLDDQVGMVEQRIELWKTLREEEEKEHCRSLEINEVWESYLYGEEKLKSYEI